MGYLPPPAGAPEIALARIAGSWRAALQESKSPTVLGVDHRARITPTWAAATEVDDGGTVTAGGGLGIAPNGADLAMVYFRRTSDTVGDLVVANVSATTGVRTGETVLEHGVLIGMAASTYLEAARAAIAGRAGATDSLVVAAAFARDATNSELRVYVADKGAPGGFRSQLVESGVFGPKGGSDGHPLLDVALDASGRAHIAWRSGGTKAIAYARLVP